MGRRADRWAADKLVADRRAAVGRQAVVEWAEFAPVGSCASNSLTFVELDIVLDSVTNDTLSEIVPVLKRERH